MHKATLTFCVFLLSPTALLAEQPAISPERVTVKMVPGITSTRQLSVSLQNARRALVQDRSISFSNMRQLADLGDGFAAQRFGQLLEKQPTPVNPTDIAHYYGIAAATGRNGAITQLINQLDQMSAADIEPRRKATLKGIVLAYAQAGNSYAADAILRYHRAEDPFGKLTTELESVLDNATGDTAADIALQLAVSVMGQPVSTAEGLKNAKDRLALAQTSTSLETQLIAQNLMLLVEKELTALPAQLEEVTHEDPA